MNRKKFKEVQDVAGPEYLPVTRDHPEALVKGLGNGYEICIWGFNLNNCYVMIDVEGLYIGSPIHETLRIDKPQRGQLSAVLRDLEARYG